MGDRQNTNTDIEAGQTHTKTHQYLLGNWTLNNWLSYLIFIPLLNEAVAIISIMTVNATPTQIHRTSVQLLYSTK